jgi:hypothetical protein
MGELALIREAGARRDLCEGEVTVLLQELLRPLDAAGQDVLVRRQPGGPLELPGEVVRAETSDRGQLLQARAGVEVFLDVLDDGAELRSGERAVPPARGTCRIRWTARTLASDSAASGPPAPPAVSSASTAHSAARSCGRSRPSSGGTVSRAGSSSNASAATRDTSPGPR